jgi:superfamily II DNA or RNA helicase
MSYFILGKPKVEERDNRIYIKNIHTRTMEGDIKRMFNTSRVSKYIFSDVSRGSVVIESFFALEFYHIVDKLSKSRTVGTSVRALHHIKEGLLANTWLANTQIVMPERLNFRQLNNLKWTPLDFQQRFLETYSQVVPQYGLRGMLLSATAGSGKTFTGLALGECLEADNIIIICPKNAVERVWTANIESVYKKTPSYWYYSSGQRYNKEKILIYHYEALKEAFSEVRYLEKRKTLVILDESHNMAEMTSQRTQRFIDFCNRIDTQDVVLASGTPIKASTLETIPVFKAIDPKFTDVVMDRFKRIFAGDANKATSILAERLGVMSFKVEKAELKLEPPIFRNLVVKIPNAKDYTLTAISIKMQRFIEERVGYYLKHKAEYQDIYDRGIKASACWEGETDDTKEWLEAEKAFKRYRRLVATVIDAHNRGRLQSVTEEIKETNLYERNVIMPRIADPELRKAFKEAKTVVKYLKLKVQGECLGRVLGRERINAHVDMVKHIDFEGVMGTTTKKTVVFTSYVEALEATHRHLESLKLKPVTVYGKNTKVLADTVRRFEGNPELNPLIATYDSLSTAVPLVMADTMILINMPFRDYVLQQAVSRIHRLGSDTQTYVYTAILDTGEESNISSRNLDILQWSQDQIEAIMKMESPFKVEYDGTDTLSEPSMEGIVDLVAALPPIEPAVHSNSTKWMEW